MQSLLIWTITVLYGTTLFSVSVTASGGVVVLVSNGSDTSIRFPAKYNHSLSLNLIRDSGTNDALQIDTTGDNGANKEPQHSIESGNQGSIKANNIDTALYNALLSDSSIIFGRDRDQEYDNSGETKVVSSTNRVSAMKAPSTSIFSLSNSAPSTPLNTGYGKKGLMHFPKSD